MSRPILLIALVLRFLLVIAAEESTCLKYVQYLRDEGNDRTKGAIVEIPQYTINSSGLHLSLEITVPFVLPVLQGNLFTLQLDQSPTDFIRAIYGSKPLRYRINVLPETANSTVSHPTLNITDVRFIIPTTGKPTASEKLAVLESKISTSTVATQPTSTVATQRSPTVATQPTSTVVTQPTSTVVTEPTSTPTVTTETIPISVKTNAKPIVNQECGRSAAMKTVNELVVRGVKTSPGEFPWLVAIFTVRLWFEFQCAGTLVSNTHVITAARCFLDDKTWMSANLFHVSAGRYRLRNWRERGSVNRNLNEYRIHPDFKIGISNADADLAILILSDRIEFTPLIQPICLWSNNSELNEIVGQSGYVVGWGEDESGNTYVEEPRMSRQPIVSQLDCLWSHPAFAQLGSNRTLCAGARDGSGPCNGDSGSGLILRDAATGRFYLRGIVSLSLRNALTMRCDLAQYVVYVDVATHLKWLKQEIAT